MLVLKVLHKNIDNLITYFSEYAQKIEEVIERNLQVMDQTATSLCKDNNMPLVVFNMNEKGNIVKACKGKINGTLVK